MRKWSSWCHFQSWVFYFFWWAHSQSLFLNSHEALRCLHLLLQQSDCLPARNSWIKNQFLSFDLAGLPAIGHEWSAKYRRNITICRFLVAPATTSWIPTIATNCSFSIGLKVGFEDFYLPVCEVHFFIIEIDFLISFHRCTLTQKNAYSDHANDRNEFASKEFHHGYIW